MSYTFHTGTGIEHAEHTWEAWNAQVSPGDLPAWVNRDDTGVCCHTCEVIVVDKPEPVSETSDTAPFNPHGEKTSDGVVITLGMRVLDYNRRTGTVTGDIDATEYRCRAVNPDVTASWSNPDVDSPCHNGWDKPTHWFDVTGDEPGGGGMFDGSRMQSIK